MTITRQQVAEQKNPTMNWQQFQEAQTREAAAARLALTGSGSRRLGNPSEPVKDERTEEQKMTDKALVQQGVAMLQAAQWDSFEQVNTLVMAAYGSTLTAPQINAMTAICFTMGFDPSPAVGHVYGYIDNGVFKIVIGYQGYIHKAEQQHEFFMYPPRPMTEAEQDAHGIRTGELGAICEIIDMKKARMAKALGMEIPRIIGTAVWRERTTWYDKTEKKEKSRQNFPPNGRTGQWVAEKNALKDALRKLGLSFGSFQIPQVEGFQYDAETDAFTQISDGATSEGHDIIEGDISDVLPADASDLARRRADVQAYGEQVYNKQWRAIRFSLIRGINATAETIEDLSAVELDQLRAVIKIKAGDQ